MPEPQPFTDVELAAYIDEALSLERTVQLESQLQASTQLRDRLQQMLGEIDSEQPGIAAFWRRRRVACPGRTTWQAFLDDRIGGEFREYLQFHLDVVGCRYCQANLDDLRAADQTLAAGRVRKFFETSVGRLQSLPAETDPVPRAQ